jgi:sec-independent protein translocase protein TatC
MPEPKLNREDYKELANNPSKILKFTEHLSELRSRIIITTSCFLVFVLLGFYLSSPLIQTLQLLAPFGSSFFQLKPGELFLSTIKISMCFSLVLSLPVFLNQLAIFISPALKDKEKKLFIGLFCLSPLLFYLGIAFAYFFLLPVLLDFLLGFRTGIVESRYGLESFLNLVISIMMISGIAFQLPVILVLLSFFKILSVNSLLKYWRHVTLGAFMLSAILTPTPDPLTMSLLAVSLLVLYFITILILKIFL